MVKATLDFPEKANRILNIVKGQFGFKNKEQANIFIIEKYEENLEPEIRPEFIKEMRNIQRGKHFGFKDIKDLRQQIEK